MRIQTSDLPILLLDTPPADVYILRLYRKKPSRVSDHKDSNLRPSALQTGQKKKFGWTICEDSNLIESRYTML